MFLTRKHLSRRTVLKGAGASIALPLLDAMIPAGTALAQTAAAPATRLGFIYFPHGALQDRMGADDDRSQPEFPFILEPLEPVRDYVTVVSGLRNKAGEGWRAARHHRGDVAHLRALRGQRNASDGRRHHGRPDRGAPPPEGHDAALDGDLRRARRHDLVPQPDAAAADGRQPAQGVHLDVRAGPDHRRSAQAILGTTGSLLDYVTRSDGRA